MSDIPSDAQYGYSPQPEPTEPPEEDVETLIDETVGEIAPWQEIEIVLEGWEYRVWDKWLNGDAHTAELLLDVLRQYDPTATMAPEKSKTEPQSPDTVYAYHFTLYGSPDGVMDAVTAINAAFLALENYKVVAGKAYVLVTFVNGKQGIIETPTKGGTDIDEALSWAVDEFGKKMGAKTEEAAAKWTPNYQHTPKALMEEDKWIDWATQLNDLINDLVSIGPQLEAIKENQSATPEQALGNLKTVKQNLNQIKRFFDDVRPLVKVEPIGMGDEAEKNVRDVFDDPSVMEAFSNLESDVDHAIAVFQTKVIQP